MPKLIVDAASAPISGITPGQSVSPIAQAIRFGDMLFLSGQGAVDPATGQVVAGDIAAQTRLTLDNLMTIVTAAGGTKANIVSLRVRLRDMTDFPRFDDAFRTYFVDEPVTRTCFGAVPNRAGVDIQIDCIAMFDR
jgi:2-iminobutanoate/2-iminopropanoate deaminase